MTGFMKKGGSSRSAGDELKERVAGLEQAVRNLSEKPVEYHITIENLHVHDPVLENLTFRLDRLDIESLSGALNLGNNFGTKVDPNGKQSGKAAARDDRASRKDGRAANDHAGTQRGGDRARRTEDGAVRQTVSGAARQAGNPADERGIAGGIRVRQTATGFTYTFGMKS